MENMHVTAAGAYPVQSANAALINGSMGGSASAKPVLTNEQIMKVLNVLKAMKAKGYADSHPEIQKLLLILREHSDVFQKLKQQQAKQQPSMSDTEVMQVHGTQPFASVSPSQSTELTPMLSSLQSRNAALTLVQLQQLQAQVSAYRHLSQNVKIPESLQPAVLGVATSNASSTGPSPATVANGLEVVTKHVQEKVAKTAKKNFQMAPSEHRLDPYFYLNDHLDSAKSGLLPSIMPQGIDPYQLVEERERLLRARMQARIQILEKLPSTLPNELKVKALIELKAMRLLEKQRQLRRDVAGFADRALRLEASGDRSVYRRLKKQTLREARLTEKMERQFRLEKDKRERQRHHEFIASVLQHARDLKDSQRLSQQRANRLGRAVLQFHTNIEREEQKRMERREKDRLRALRADDEEAYMRLIDQTKDSRLVHLLRQTDDYLKMLGSLVVEQKRTSNDEEDPSLLLPKISDSTTMSEEVKQAAADDERQEFYQIVHSISEVVAIQPSLLVGGKLKEYQLRGLQWMISLYNNSLNGILADEMGLGKTIQTIALVTHLMEHKQQNGPYLVIVPLSTLTNWVLEFEKWAPSVGKIVYKGAPSVRKQIYQTQIRNAKFNVLLTTYEYIIRDKSILAKIKWTYLIVDEGHRMKNAHCKLAQTLTQYYTCRHRLLLTGTPLQNNLPELWALLNFLLPKIFNSCRNFEDWFNVPFANTGEVMELNEEEKLLVIKRLHKVLRPFLFRRLKKDVESELPDKVERVIKCEMSALQRRLYERVKYQGLQNINGVATNDGKGKKIFGRSLNNTIVQLRKICNHPFVYEHVERQMNPEGINCDLLIRAAGKFELLDRVLPKLRAAGHKVLMFFQMTQIMNIMEDYCQWRGLTYLRLDGTTKSEDRSGLLTKFNAPGSSYFMFLLSTRAGGLGLNLQTADTVIIFDSDWNPHQDLQAQDRAHRIGQTKEVRVYRLITIDSVEEYILTRAQFKLDVDEKVIQAGKFDQKTTAEERETLLRALFDDDEKQEENEVFDDTELNEVVARNDTEMELFKHIDDERERQRREAWQKLARKGKLPSRLMEETELPQLYLEENVRDEESGTSGALAEDLVGRGQRQHKREVLYDDGLTEEQWVRVIEQGENLEDVIEKKRQRKMDRLHGKRSTTDLETPPKKRGRSKKKLQRSEDDEDEDDANDSENMEDEGDDNDSLAENENQGSFTPKDNDRKVNSRDDDHNEGNDKLRERKDSEQRDFALRLKTIYDAMASACDDDGRSRSELFLALPSRRDYPDYYEMIKTPIAMDRILKRIHSHGYSSEKAFLVDVDRMVKNAMTYNVEGSQVYEDALVLQRLAKEAIELRVPPAPAQIAVDKEAPIKLKFKLSVKSDSPKR